MPHVRGTSNTEMDEVSVYCDVWEGGRSQSFGIAAKTDSRFDCARVCQSAMSGAVVVAMAVSDELQSDLDFWYRASSRRDLEG